MGFRVHRGGFWGYRLWVYFWSGSPKPLYQGLATRLVETVACDVEIRVTSPLQALKEIEREVVAGDLTRDFGRPWLNAATVRSEHNP